MIDWVKYNDASIYTTANSDIDNIGAETLLHFDFIQLWGSSSIPRHLTLSYCYNYKYRVNEEQSANYASRMTFLRHKFVASLNHRILKHLSAQWDFTLKNRKGEFDNAQTGQPQSYGTFGTLDLKAQWETRLYTLYLQANNLTNHKYYDFANVQQPGLWLMAGAKLRLGL